MLTGVLTIFEPSQRDRHRVAESVTESSQHQRKSRDLVANEVFCVQGLHGVCEIEPAENLVRGFSVSYPQVQFLARGVWQPGDIASAGPFFAGRITANYR